MIVRVCSGGLELHVKVILSRIDLRLLDLASSVSVHRSSAVLIHSIYFAFIPCGWLKYIVTCLARWREEKVAGLALCNQITEKGKADA